MIKFTGMLRYLSILLCLGMLSSVIAEEGAGGGDNQLIGQTGVSGSKLIVVGFFHAERPDERERAHLVETAITRTCRRSDVTFLGIALSETGNSSGDASVWISQPGRQFFELAEEHRRSGATLFIVDQKGRIRYQKVSYQPSEVLMEIKALLMTTKVDESTWGKIKELFRR